MPVHASRFQKGCTAFPSAPKFMVVACMRIDRNRQITLECQLICRIAIGIWTDGKDCGLIIKGKGLFDCVEVHWDVAEEFFISLR